MVFKIEEFKKDCAEKLVHITKVDGLNRMDLSRLRRGNFDGIGVKKFMIVCKQMNISPEVYTSHDLVF